MSKKLTPIETLRRRMQAAAHSARKAATPLFLFGVWVGVSLMGPELRWTEIDRWELMVACVIGYGLFTAGAMGGLLRGAAAVTFDPALRHTLRAHFVPYWALFLLALGVGAGVFVAWPGVIVAVWLAGGAALSTLLLGLLVARIVEVTRLRRRLHTALKAPKQPSRGRPSSTTLQTWPSTS